MGAMLVQLDCGTHSRGAVREGWVSSLRSLCLRNQDFYSRGARELLRASPLHILKPRDWAAEGTCRAGRQVSSGWQPPCVGYPRPDSGQWAEGTEAEGQRCMMASWQWNLGVLRRVTRKSWQSTRWKETGFYFDILNLGHREKKPHQDVTQAV